MNRLLYRVKNGTVTKYVYGLGLIGEETQSAFKTYHFDSRGSTVAVTNASGTVTDTFAYDAYGNLLSRTGTSEIIFGYCGKYGIITDENGLAYMRARYYVPEMRRFVNADLLAGGIADIASLNRYAYANGNPISNIDPYGLSPWDLVKGAYRWAKDKVVETANWVGDKISGAAEWVSDKASEIGRAVTGAAVMYAVAQSNKKEIANVLLEIAEDKVNTATTPARNWVDSKIADAKKWGTEKYNTTKEIYHRAKEWLEDANEAVSDWLEPAKNYDGSYSLYDNMRFENVTRLKKKADFIFHEQFLVLNSNPAALKFDESKLTVASFDLTLMTGGWEWENGDLSLLDFGSASAEMSFNFSGEGRFIDIKTEFAIWKPSFSFNAFGKKITLTGYVGGYNGGLEVGLDFSSGSVGLGIFKVAWE